MVLQNNWSRDSWRGFNIKQQPEYSDDKISKLKIVEHELSRYPSLVDFEEINLLKKHLKRVEKGEAFILQGLYKFIEGVVPRREGILSLSLMSPHPF
jgi:3-deoxy-D-arabino-heptulosonate 7-phosphate (DAHP) synthase class II